MEETESSDDSGPNVGAIVGGVFGGLFGALLIGVGIAGGFYIIRRKKADHLPESKEKELHEKSRISFTDAKVTQVDLDSVSKIGDTIDASEIKIIETVGHGGFGQVYLAGSYLSKKRKFGNDLIFTFFLF
jgi:hypothetical protein